MIMLRKFRVIIVLLFINLRVVKLRKVKQGRKKQVFCNIFGGNFTVSFSFARPIADFCVWHGL